VTAASAAGEGVQVACVDVPALALQLVMRAHPEWQADPVVVVEDDRPFATIVWVNRAARTHGITRGMSFAQAKAASARLHAEVVAEDALERGINALFELLIPFSPHIEPVLEQPGLFWLDPRGLGHLFGDATRWAAAIHAALSSERYKAAVVVGQQRARVFAIARALGDDGRGSLVLRDGVQEQRWAERVPLDRLELEPRLMRELATLGVQRVGDLLALPLAELRVRYGPEAARLHTFLSGHSWTPLLPRAPDEPLLVQLEVEPPDDDHTRILFGLKSVLHNTCERLRSEHHGIGALEITLQLERLGEHHERIEAAAPTLDVIQWVDLLRLRLGNVELPARVERIVLRVEHRRIHARQLVIEHGNKPRDLEAASRAIARLRASFGEAAVTCARLREAHLPEGGFRFEPTRAIRLPQLASHAGSFDGELPLIRRVYAAPIALPTPPNHEPEAWLGHHGAVTAMHGPYRIAGGWWTRRRERDYHFVETQQGEVLWVFYDRTQRKWYLQGEVD
jgi:protein ImuB